MNLDKETLRQKYGKLYCVGVTLEPDDETEIKKEYCFVKPKVASFNRYMKTGAANHLKAMQVFVRDNIVEEQREALEQDMEEYPALVLNLGERLFAVLGFSSSSNLISL